MSNKTEGRTFYETPGILVKMTIVRNYKNTRL